MADAARVSDASAAARRESILPLHIGLGEEWIPPGEADDIASMLTLLRQVQEQSDRKREPVPRDQHPKQHACLFAELRVLPGLPVELRHGIFREPQTFPAVIRLSNARQRHDELPDAHGFALKLVGVAGPRLLDDEAGASTQDFVLVDHPVFFMRDVAAGVSLVRDFKELKTGGLLQRARVVLRGLASQERGFQIMRAMSAKRPRSLLATRYWCTTPVRLGPLAVKLSVRPRTRPEDAPRCRGRDRHRLDVARRLAAKETRFDFLIQRQQHPVDTPVEDPTVEWDETAAPFERVAEIRIPMQNVTDPARLAFGERLSFTPWHGVREHAPLGGINRARRAIYQALSERRRMLNGVPLREPDLADLRALWPELCGSPDVRV